MHFLKKFKEISKKKNSHTSSYTLTFLCTTVFKEVSFLPCVLVHTLCFIVSYISPFFKLTSNLRINSEYPIAGKFLLTVLIGNGCPEIRSSNNRCAVCKYCSGKLLTRYWENFCSWSLFNWVRLSLIGGRSWTFSGCKHRCRKQF